MSRPTDVLELPAVVNHLRDLASEIDGVVDFGMLVCLMEEKMPTGHQYIAKRCEKIRDLLTAIVDFLGEWQPNKGEDVALWRTQLARSGDQFVTAFGALEHFRGQDSDMRHHSLELLRTGWEGTHRAIREIAHLLDLPDTSWYTAIQERQEVFRTTLGELPAWFQEVANTS